MILVVHCRFTIDSMKSHRVYNALRSCYYRSFSLQYSSSEQSKTRYNTVSGTSLYLYSRVAIPRTFLSNRNTLSLTLPVLTYISSELSCLRSPQYQVSALQYSSLQAPSRVAVQFQYLSGESAIAFQFRHLYLYYSISTFFILQSPAQPIVQYILPSLYSSERYRSQGRFWSVYQHYFSFTTTSLQTPQIRVPIPVLSKYTSKSVTRLLRYISIGGIATSASRR